MTIVNAADDGVTRHGGLAPDSERSSVFLQGTCFALPASVQRWQREDGSPEKRCNGWQDTARRQAQAIAGTAGDNGAF